MNARVVPAARGLRWLAEGWRMFRVAPLGWLALVFGYWLAMTILSLVPLIGLVAASILVPVFSVGFMTASRAASRGQPVELAMLFAGFRERLPAQLALGAVYLAALAVTIGGSAFADGGELARWLLTGKRPEDEALQGDGLLGGMAAAAALYAPVMMMYWFAPLLAAWHGMAPPQALFYSFFACLMNWRAFLAYGAAVAFVMFVLPTLVLALLLILLPTLFASFFASYRDVFGAQQAAAPQT